MCLCTFCSYACESVCQRIRIILNLSQPDVDKKTKAYFIEIGVA